MTKTKKKKKISNTGKYRYVNGAQCPRCEEKIWSRHRHDFRYCSCKYVFVDGGRDYLRSGWGDSSKLDAQGCADTSPGKPRYCRIRVPAEEVAKHETVHSSWPY